MAFNGAAKAAASKNHEHDRKRASLADVYRIQIMNTKRLALTAIVISLVALVLELASRVSFDRAVMKVTEERERAYCEKLVAKMNEGRRLMGLPPASPTNFAEVLRSYFESMASVMDQGVTNRLESRTPRGK